MEVEGRWVSREGRSQSRQEWRGPISQDSMRKLGKLSWQRKWHGGIPEEGTKKKEKLVGLKPGHEGKRLWSLAPVWLPTYPSSTNPWL